MSADVAGVVVFCWAELAERGGAFRLMHLLCKDARTACCLVVDPARWVLSESPLEPYPLGLCADCLAGVRTGRELRRKLFAWP